MTLKQWIQRNKTEIDAAIKRAYAPGVQNTEDRRLWVLNDENLYKWAKSDGVSFKED